MKLISWNVNGIRAASRGGFLDWMKSQKADVICVQETKANPEQLEPELREPKGYTSFWHSAQKPGYSGTAIYTKKDPLRIQTGIGIPEIDNEGRVLIAEYPEVTLINCYFPNSQRDHARLPYKLRFCDEILKLCNQYRRQGVNVAICGDYNIAHTEIDLKNPKTNQDNAGFLPAERAWMTKFLGAGYIDTFRHFTPDPGHYTWWSYRPGVREKNIGWRIDYFCVNEELKGRLKKAWIQPDVKGSDHCPVVLELKI
jgi:exodeoxyribonuclease-3